MHKINDVIQLFNGLFKEAYDTILVRGDTEPIYRVKSENCPFYQIVFAHGFFSSALHEIAHWCVAGPKRRQVEDYGYWYKPDGRTEAEQSEFERVEIKPQALEWAFSVAAGLPFHFSADNLTGQLTDMSLFKENVLKQVHDYFDLGFPKRADLFLNALIQFYQPEQGFKKRLFVLKAPVKRFVADGKPE